ncbi:hypothetical protein VTJ49DRAFT_2374 [Mycothermus thermophilus]|uniref:Uncharacterized protein n=1 Tax=Humicola insolens TaxID=85995 RepID=A0ABR3VP92_HUMIN
MRILLSLALHSFKHCNYAKLMRYCVIYLDQLMKFDLQRHGPEKTNAGQAGRKISSLPSASVALDSRRKPSSLLLPTIIKTLSPVFVVSTASEHSLAVAADGKVYIWGLNLTKQIGQKDEEFEVPTLLAHEEVADKRFVWVGAGAQFSMFGEAVDSG